MALGPRRDLSMPARKDQLWKGICWPGCALKNSASPYTRLVDGRGENAFFGDQFQHQKMLPQRDFAVGGFSGLEYGRQQQLGTPLKPKCLGIACP